MEIKRLIPKIILGTGIITSLTFGANLVSTNYPYAIKLDDLNKQKDAIYQQFMSCDDFGNSFKAELSQLLENYANDAISYEEFEQKIQYLKSVEYAQVVLKNSNNQLKTEVEALDTEINQVKDNRSSAVKVPLIASISSVIVAGIGFGSLAITDILNYDESTYSGGI